MAPIEIDQSRFNLAAQNEAKEGAVLILFYPDRGNIHFPLIQRSKYEGVHSGQVALPGGKKEKEEKEDFSSRAEGEEQITDKERKRRLKLRVKEEFRKKNDVCRFLCFLS